jgi:hypothetical protein
MKIKLFSVVILLALLAGTACSLPLVSNTSSTNLQATQESLNATAMAIGVQQTVIALQQSPTSQTTEQPPTAQVPTTEPPTVAPPTVAPPTATATPQDVNSFLQTANVLIYEDVAGTSLIPDVKRAADGLGMKNYTHVGDDIGKFMQLASGPITYDLVVVAAETRSIFKGELFDAVISQVNRGASVVIEIWYLDQIINGKAKPLMNQCGVDYYSNWTRNPGYDKNDYALLWIEPTSPIFNKPNVVQPLYRIRFYWSGDVGDLMQLTPSSTAHQLAAPVSYTYTRDHGLLYSCIDGRMVLQTFSTHDYADADMQMLWQNYMYNTLQARLDYLAAHP